MDEESFVDYLKENFKFSGYKGIGDDCSVVKINNSYQLISKDLLIENVHFNLDFYNFIEIGKKSISVNVSDIVAMGGIPEYFYLGLGFPFKRFSNNDLIELLKGIKEFSEIYDIELAGGDLTYSEELVISITIVGKTDKPILRSNAKEGDLICISDFVGESALGLNMLKRDKSIDNYFTRKHKTPEINIPLSKLVSRYANSMIDISDGLLKDLNRILKESDKGAEIYLDRIKYKEDFKDICRDFGYDYKELMLSGGEDYVLLFTISHENLKKLKNSKYLFYDIGIIKEELGLKVFENKKKLNLKISGFDHFDF